MPDERPIDSWRREQLKRKARSIRIEANRAPAQLAAQLVALAALYEREAENSRMIRQSVRAHC